MATVSKRVFCGINRLDEVSESQSSAVRPASTSPVQFLRAKAPKGQSVQHAAPVDTGDLARLGWGSGNVCVSLQC